MRMAGWLREAVTQSLFTAAGALSDLFLAVLLLE